MVGPLVFVLIGLTDVAAHSRSVGTHTPAPQQVSTRQIEPDAQSVLLLQVGRPAQGVLPGTQKPPPWATDPHTQSESLLLHGIKVSQVAATHPGNSSLQ